MTWTSLIVPPRPISTAANKIFEPIFADITFKKESLEELTVRTGINFDETDRCDKVFRELFEYRAFIGSGGFGWVIAAYDKTTDEEIAIKLLNKSTSSMKVIELFKQEANILQSMNNPYVIGFRFFKEFTNYLWLGMELWVGGNLTEWIIHNSSIDVPEIEHEENCALIIKNILLGTQYIHYNHEIIHRDLKPGNILFKTKDDLNSLKIWDFGLANNVGVGFFDQNNEKVGTIIYQAPEQMQRISYGKAVDIWAIGMIMYELLTKGGHPELGPNIHKKVNMQIDDYITKISNIDSSYKVTDKLKGFSKLSRSLIKNLCDPKPNRRYNAQRALKHPWITRNENDSIPLNLYEELQSNLINIDNGKFFIIIYKPDFLFLSHYWWRSNVLYLDSILEEMKPYRNYRDKQLSMPLNIPIEKFSNGSDSSEDEKLTSESTKSVGEKSSNNSNKSNLDIPSNTQSWANSSNNSSTKKIIQRAKIVKNTNLLSVSSKKKVTSIRRNKSARKRLLSVNKFSSDKYKRKNTTNSNYKEGYLKIENEPASPLLPPIQKWSTKFGSSSGNSSRISLKNVPTPDSKRSYVSNTMLSTQKPIMKRQGNMKKFSELMANMSPVNSVRRDYLSNSIFKNTNHIDNKVVLKTEEEKILILHKKIDFSKTKSKVSVESCSFYN